MNLDDIKDQLKDQFDQTRRQVVESEAFLTLKEKYDVLPQKTQQIIAAVGALLLVGLLVYPPVSILLESSTKMQEFEEQKQMIRQLLKAQHELKQGPSGPSSLPPAAVEARIQGVFSSAKLIEEQIGEIQRVPAKVADHTLSGVLTQGFVVNLSKLNVRQIADIGYSLQSISPTVKLTQLTAEPDREDDHYFNVRYLLGSFSVPKVTVPKQEEPPKKKKRSRRRSRGNS